MQRPWRRPYRSAPRQYCRNEARDPGVPAIRHLIASVQYSARAPRRKLSMMKRALIFVVAALMAAAFAFFLIAEQRPAPKAVHSTANVTSGATASARSTHD